MKSLSKVKKEIKLHSIIYVKNYLFEEWNYRQRKQNLVKKKKERKIFGYLTSGTAQSSQTHPLIYWWSARLFGGGCQQCSLLSSAVGRPFFAQQPATFWFLAVCGCFFEPMGLVTHTVSVTELWCLERRESVFRVTRSKEKSSKNRNITDVWLRNKSNCYIILLPWVV